jgi:photosystem II stability/assembly factor-like uncharacterized protein
MCGIKQENMNSKFTIAILIFTVQNLFGQFQICNSSTNQDLHDVWFIDQTVGVSVGDSGTILRSVDGGLNWTLIMSNDTVNFKKIKFFDTQNGIAIGTDIYRTNDAGLTWTNIPHSNGVFYDIEILNPTTCLISGSPIALIKSFDTGVSFSNIVPQQNQNIALMSFIDENIGYACVIWDGGPNPTLKTVNGGMSWDTLSHLNHNTVMEAMSFISESVGFKGGWYNPNLQKTTDSANSWNYITYMDTQAAGQIIDFHIEPDMSNSFYACGWYGQIFKSTDGGNNWGTLNSGLSNTTSLYGIYFKSDSVGWAVGANGTIIKTTNGGQTVGLSEFQEKPNLTVYPNPTKEWLNINNPNNYEIIQIEIYNLSGQKLVSEHNLNKIDLISLANGMYFIKIKTNKGDYLERIVKI